ncbi:MAG: septal ring lytic transglycosylase RlpA family protein [Desulforhopalus sp.]
MKEQLQNCPHIQKINWHPSRFILLFVFCITILLFVNGCSLKKPSTQPDVTGYRERGIASYYAKKFNLRKTASGEIFDNNLMTAAHKTLPFGTRVVVKNLNNGKSVKVIINDRGPFKRNRIIDLTRAAFSKIEDIHKGLTKVEILVE